MTEIGKFLNADLSTIGGLLARGGRWWLDELRFMLPTRWRRRNRNPARPILWVTRDGFRAGGRNAPKAGMAICLPSDAGLVRVLHLPPMSTADLRRLVALELDRLSPFESRHVLFDILLGPKRGERQAVLVGILPRTTAQAVLEDAHAQGLAPSALALADQDGHPCFDFLPALDCRGNESRRVTPARLWMAAAVLAAVNLTIFTARDILEIADLRQQVEDMRPGIQAAAKLRAMVETEASRRADLIRRKQRQSPLPILDSLTRSLPDTVWVQQLEWDGAKLRIVGWSRDGADSLALVEADPLLANARPCPPTASESPMRGKPFDITAEHETGEHP
ncbi:MAG: PilN domain-containing protein [Bacteroidota bacterium]